MKKSTLWTIIGLSALGVVLIGILIYVIVSKTSGYTGNEADPFVSIGDSMVLTAPGISFFSISGISAMRQQQTPLGLFYFS